METESQHSRPRPSTRSSQAGSSDQSPSSGSRPESPGLLEELRSLNEQLVISSVRQQELAEQAARSTVQLNALLDSLAEGVIVADAEGHLAVANPPARAALGLPTTGPLTRVRDWNKIDLRHPNGRPLAYEERPLSRALRGERFMDYEVLAVLSDGESRRIAFAGSAVRDASGQVVRAILVFRDVTEVRELEKLKEDYVSLISHDLRAPLTVILGQSWLLDHVTGPLTVEEARTYATAIERNARRMQKMIEDLLLTTRLETGRIVLAKQRLDLADVVHAVVATGIEPESRPRVHVAAAEPIPLVMGNREHLERVITNLLINALKFSPAGSPIGVEIGKRGDNVVVSVADSGFGMAPEHLAHVFEKYYRGMPDERKAGLGLGLYISRLIVEASDGRIWAESTVGKGSTFRFSLPIR